MKELTIADLRRLAAELDGPRGYIINLRRVVHLTVPYYPPRPRWTRFEWVPLRRARIALAIYGRRWWLRRPGARLRRPAPYAYLFENELLCHPALYKKLAEAFPCRNDSGASVF